MTDPNSATSSPLPNPNFDNNINFKYLLLLSLSLSLSTPPPSYNITILHFSMLLEIIYNKTNCNLTEQPSARMNRAPILVGGGSVINGAYPV